MMGLQLLAYKWKKEGKEMTDEIIGWHHQLNGHGLNKLLEMVKDKEAWSAAVHGAAKSWTWLSDWKQQRIFFWPLNQAPVKFYLPWSISLKLCFWGVVCCFANQALSSSRSPLFLYTVVSLDAPYGQQFPGGVCWGCGFWFHNKCIDFFVYWLLMSKVFFPAFPRDPMSSQVLKTIWYLTAELGWVHTSFYTVIGSLGSQRMKAWVET